MALPRKVRSGQRLSGNLSASGQNYLRRLMAKDRGSQLDREGGPAVAAGEPGLFVLAKSGQMLSLGQWAYLTEPLYSAAGREARFPLESPLQTGSAEKRLLAMAAEPVAEGQVGRFQIAGLCRTKIHLPETEHDLPFGSAELDDGAPQLVGRQDDAGEVQIVWHDTPGSSAGDVWAIVRLPGFGQAVQAIEITGPDAEEKEDGDELDPGDGDQWEGKILGWETTNSEAVQLGEVLVFCPEYTAGKPRLRLGQVVIARLVGVNDSGKSLYFAELSAEAKSGVTAIKATLNSAPAQWPDGEEYEHGRQVASATVSDIGSGTAAEIDETVDIEFPHVRGRKIAVESGSVVSAVLIDDTTTPKRFVITSDYTTGSSGATVVKAQLNDTPAQWPNGDEYEPGVQTMSAEVTQVSSGGTVEVEELIDIEFPHVPGQLVAVQADDIVSAVLIDDTTSPKRFVITSDYTRPDTACGVTYDEDGHLAIDPAPIAGPGLKVTDDSEESGCQIMFHAGTGLAIADGLGDGSVYFDAEYVAGKGMAADGSQLHAAVGHALGFDLGGNVEVRPNELIGPGTELGPSGTIAVNDGFAIQIDGGAVAVDSSQLSGLGTKVDSNKALEVVAQPNGGLEVSSGGVRAVEGDGIQVNSQVSVRLQDGSPVTVVTKVECVTNEDGKAELEITYASLALKVDASGLYLEATI